MKKKQNLTKTEIKKLVDDLGVTETWRDRVCPSALEFKRDSLVLEQAYCTIYSIFNYPSEVGLKWLRPISRIENTMVCIYNEKGDKSELMKSIDFSIREQQIKQAETVEKQLTAAVDAQDKIDKTVALAQRVQADNVNIGKITIYILVYAESQDELKAICKDVEGRLSAYRFVARRIPYLMEDGFDAMNPCLENKYSEMTSLTMPLDVFYAGMGIVPSFGINDSTGIYLGFDESANPIFLDLWSKSNQKTNMNLSILGKSGSGKSATVKALMVHELSQGTKLFVLDPEEEYLALAEYFKGNIIDASGGLNPDGKRSIINPLQLTDFPEELDDLSEEEIKTMKNDSDFKGSVSNRISILKGWFKLYQPELSMAHIALIEEALYETYKRKGLDETSDPRKMANEEHPILTDLGNVLKEFKEKAKEGSEEEKLYNEILIYLSSALHGSDRFLFNGHTNVDLSNKFNVFNVHKLLNAPDNIKNAQFSNLMSFIWLSLTKNRKEKSLLAVDEAHLFINKGSITTFEFLGQLCKRARKYSSGLWIMTQNISDFLHKDVARYGEGILNNSATKLIMKSDATDLQKLSDLFNLNEGETQRIKDAGVGQGLLIAGDMRVFSNIEIELSVLRLAQLGGGK
ncbi:MAG: DUF87 domain-containing protein [Erysipelotrichaceae bacterium]|nr:DUF87 domain-containing protein [Erysipelotrichaceae bacterium]